MALKYLRMYGDLVKRRPFLTQTVTAGILSTAGDVVAQYTEKRKTRYSFRRTAVMSACGFLYFGPVVSVWLNILHKLNLPVMFTVALDQSFAAPLILGGFSILHPLLSNQGITGAISTFKSSFFDILKANWVVWIPAQTINFSFVPFEYRMLFVQVVAIFWNMFLSYRANVALKKKETTTGSNM
uniref:Mitochondrial inner membrane protein Mpv17 n=1 Tax=Phallusia mammillata TaxID=59560 RepID=A0A6F9DL78_9ASCI|nr:PXMP2/4 family protein 2-like [Phallusia mammillata]